MAKKIIATKQAPAAVGPYSQGVRAGKLLFTAGQIPLDPESGELVGGDIATQTHQVMKNIQAILASAGASLEDVVKTTIFLQDMDDFTQMNGVYGSYFKGDPPARSTVQVSRLPLGAAIEIEVVARIPGK